MRIHPTSTTLLVGAGRMGGALLRCWVAGATTSIVVVESNPSQALKKFTRANRIPVHRSVDGIRNVRIGACVIALKPQVLAAEAPRLRSIAESGAFMLSIAAGTRIATLRAAWGRRARIVRAMPNTPGAVGHGITALYAPANVSAQDRERANALLAGLGQTAWVKTEKEIDIVTAVSGSGPAYVYLLAEALAAAGEAEGLKRHIAELLARATVIGAGALLDADARAPCELRRDVTSPGGTTEAALKVLMGRAGLRNLLGRAVAAARKRAAQLSGSR